MNHNLNRDEEEEDNKWSEFRPKMKCYDLLKPFQNHAQTCHKQIYVFIYLCRKRQWEIHNFIYVKWAYLFSYRYRLIHRRVSSLQCGSFQWSLPNVDAPQWVPWRQCKQNNDWIFFNAILSSDFQECACLVGITHSNPTNPAVALDTRNTRAGLILFPPAPNIRWAADTKAGFSSPTICRHFS